jgi:hypothetical protein
MSTPGQACWINIQYIHVSLLPLTGPRAVLSCQSRLFGCRGAAVTWRNTLNRLARSNNRKEVKVDEC